MKNAQLVTSILQNFICFLNIFQRNKQVFQQPRQNRQSCPHSIRAPFLGGVGGLPLPLRTGAIKTSLLPVQGETLWRWERVSRSIHLKDAQTCILRVRFRSGGTGAQGKRRRVRKSQGGQRKASHQRETGSFSSSLCSASADMPNFAGTWKMKSSENFDELLKALGKPSLFLPLHFSQHIPAWGWRSIMSIQIKALLFFENGMPDFQQHCIVGRSSWGKMPDVMQRRTRRRYEALDDEFLPKQTWYCYIGRGWQNIIYVKDLSRPMWAQC